jgi:aryl-alcohol dehydrogenase
MDIRAAVTQGQAEAFSLEDVTLSGPHSNEVLVRIVATGVCHTDAVARDLAISPYPIVLGHEGAGVVEQVGENVTDRAPGDHVVLSFAHCGKCENCLTGHPAYCLIFNDLNFGGRMEDGSFRLSQGDTDLATFFGQSSFGTYAVVNARNAVKVDQAVDLALLGPLGCGIQTGAGTVLNALRPEFGSAIAVYGCGAVGLSAIMAAQIAGCPQIFAVDVHDSRLDLARQLGATHAFNGQQVDVVKEIKTASGGGTRYAVETTGVPSVVRQALQALRPLGRAAIVGVTPEMSLDVHNDLMAAGKAMIGVIEGDSVPRVFIPQLIAHYQAGRFPFDRLVKFYDFAAINQAFEDSRQGVTIKPVLNIA